MNAPVPPLASARHRHEFDDRPRLFYLNLFLWTVIAIVAATTTFIATGSSSWSAWLTYAFYMGAYFYAWSGLAIAIYALTDRPRASSQAHSRRCRPMVHVGFLLCITVALPLVLHPLSWRAWLYGEHAAGFHALNAFVYAFAFTSSHLVRWHRLTLIRERQAQADEHRAMALERDLSDAQVRALRNQVNPHFLFNTLNAISSLISSGDDDRAMRVTGLLGSLLRTALYETNTVEVPVRRELELLEGYVEIEKIRFGDKFRFEKHVDPTCLDRPVPSLLLQPLVENAVKYAVSPSPAPVCVRVQIRDHGDGMHLRVADDGPGNQTQPVNSRGVGLRNVRDRLALLYGDDARLDVRTSIGEGFCVDIRLPSVSVTERKPATARDDLAG